MRKIILLLFCGFMICCSGKMSSDELSNYLGPLIVKDISSSADISESNIKLKTFTLVHNVGNNYSGILITSYDGLEQTFDIEVVYDGENYKFEYELIEEK